jgi:hypothetical protein
VHAFANLPAGIHELGMRGDLALYIEEALTWLDEQGISFAVSADMVKPLARIIEGLHEGSWQTYMGLKDPEQITEEREWAEVVDYVPDWKRNNRPGAVPIRYIAIRIRPRQRDLFDEADRQLRTRAAGLLRGHQHGMAGRPPAALAPREAGHHYVRVAFGHGVQKNDLGAGVMP